MKISIVIILDNLFKFLLLFIFNIIWCLYFIKTPIISLIVALFVALVTLFVLNIASKKRNGKKHISLKKQQHIEDVKNTFIYMSHFEIMSFFKSLIKTKHSLKVENNYILIDTNSLPILLFVEFNYSNFTVDDILKLYKSIKHKNLKRLVILTNKYDNEILNICKSFKFETVIFDYKQTYINLLEPYCFYPEIKRKKIKEPRATFSSILNIILDKKRTKSYLLSAIFLVFSSFFVIYKVYYLIFSSILITLAFFSYFKPRTKLNTNINVLN